MAAAAYEATRLGCSPGPAGEVGEVGRGQIDCGHPLQRALDGALDALELRGLDAGRGRHDDVDDDVLGRVELDVGRGDRCAAGIEHLDDEIRPLSARPCRWRGVVGEAVLAVGVGRAVGERRLLADRAIDGTDPCEHIGQAALEADGARHDGRGRRRRWVVDDDRWDVVDDDGRDVVDDGRHADDGIDDRLRAIVEDARHRQLMLLLEPPDRALGRGPEPSLLAGDGEADALQLSLEIDDVGAFHALGEVAIRHGVLRRRSRRACDATVVTALVVNSDPRPGRRRRPTPRSSGARMPRARSSCRHS